MLLDQDDYLAVFGPLPGQVPTAPPGASTWQQIARGFSSGVSFGLDKPLGLRPYEEAGPGGWPETLSSLAGMGVGFTPLTRAAGMGVAGAGAIFPKLLAAGVRPGAAATTMLKPGFGALPKALSDAGRLSTYALSGAAGATLPELVEPEARTLPGTVIQTLLGAGLGAAGARIAGVKWRGAAGTAGTRATDILSPAPGVIGATEQLIQDSSKTATEALRAIRLEMADVTAQIANAPNKRIKKDWQLYKRTLQNRIDYLERRSGAVHPPTGPIQEDDLAALRRVQASVPPEAADLEALRQFGQSGELARGMSLKPPALGGPEDLALRQVQAGVSTAGDPLAVFGRDCKSPHDFE